MKGLIIFLLSTLAIFSPAHGGNYNPRTLSEADWQLEALDRKRGPALTADANALRYWESYNQWLCFPAHAVDILRVTVTYEGERKSMPQIDVEWAGHLFQISIDADSEDNFNEITAAGREIAFNLRKFAFMRPSYRDCRMLAHSAPHFGSLNA